MHSLDQAWQAIAGQFEEAQSRARENARAKTCEELNQIARRLKQYGAETDWYDAVLDGAAQFVSETAIFSVEHDILNAKGTRGFSLPADFSIPLAQAAAFRNARDTGEVVIALRTKGEVSEALAASSPDDRGYVLPISNGARISAMLFAAAGPESNLNALELIVTMASAMLERHSQQPSHVQIAAPAIKIPEPPAQSGLDGPEPSWHMLPDSEKLLHVRAKRFGRSRVAEMQLYRPEACRSGREQRDLYLFLKPEIDGAREVFRNQFMSAQSMEDYLHLELVSQLANNDDSLLGKDYPGEMV